MSNMNKIIFFILIQSIDFILNCKPVKGLYNKNNFGILNWLNLFLS